jgi:hypothetical protein
MMPSANLASLRPVVITRFDGRRNVGELADEKKPLRGSRLARSDDVHGSAEAHCRTHLA